MALADAVLNRGEGIIRKKDIDAFASAIARHTENFDALYVDAANARRPAAPEAARRRRRDPRSRGARYVGRRAPPMTSAGYNLVLAGRPERAAGACRAHRHGPPTHAAHDRRLSHVSSRRVDGVSRAPARSPGPKLRRRGCSPRRSRLLRFATAAKRAGGRLARILVS